MEITGIPNHTGLGWILIPPRGIKEEFRRRDTWAGLGRQVSSGLVWAEVLSRERQRPGLNEVVRARKPRAKGLYGPWEPTLQSLSLESALDDLDLNEFGVAALEKTFDNSTVPHPSNITIGTGRG